MTALRDAFRAGAAEYLKGRLEHRTGLASYYNVGWGGPGVGQGWAGVGQSRSQDMCSFHWCLVGHRVGQSIAS